MGQSYAQNFPKPSRPERELQSWLASGPQRIYNNPNCPPGKSVADFS
ncbi:hypothetical protein BRAO375_4920004 [Bradyrhizobium sp. ORS 375]|nr:hypothetical protein BRAO375_4920004 [Bradyrhizobium sp. ORS 375]